MSRNEKDKLSFLQWNSRSIKSNKNSLKNVLSENEMDIILLSETWLKPEDTIYFNNYNIVRQNRNDGFAGVAILIKKDVLTKT